MNKTDINITHDTIESVLKSLKHKKSPCPVEIIKELKYTGEEVQKEILKSNGNTYLSDWKSLRDIPFSREVKKHLQEIIADLPC